MHIVKSIYLILALLLITVTSGFTVRHELCRTDMGSSGVYQVTTGAETPPPACCASHSDRYRLQEPFFAPERQTVPAGIDRPVLFLYAVVVTGNHISSSYQQPDTRRCGPVTGGGKIPPQALIAVFLI